MGRAGADKQTTTVRVDGGSGIALEGDLAVPEHARGIVLFAHGSGSSRRSPRNQFVARVLREAGLGTLLFDLLTQREDAVYETRFNIDLLAQRLSAATAWMTQQPVAASLGVGYFGASTGAAAALIAAAELGPSIGAVVSRGGRPDMAEAALDRVTAPTLLIVGGLDDVVIDLNRQAFAGLRSEKRLVIVPGATHLFEEPGTLDEVAQLAADWFLQWLKNR
jgi:pimeloyl-ACP methyl ester carboxylesterase